MELVLRNDNLDLYLERIKEKKRKRNLDKLKKSMGSNQLEIVNYKGNKGKKRKTIDLDADQENS
jgi:hypothetical protein